jgi:hypothetical protein
LGFGQSVAVINVNNKLVFHEIYDPYILENF